MKKLNLYISEKLKLNKDIKIESIPEQMIRICGFEEGKEKNAIDIINEWVSDNKITAIKIYMDLNTYGKIVKNLQKYEIDSVEDKIYKVVEDNLYKDKTRHLLLNDMHATILGAKKWLAIGNITKYRTEHPVFFIKEELAEKIEELI